VRGASCALIDEFGANCTIGYTLTPIESGLKSLFTKRRSCAPSLRSMLGHPELLLYANAWFVTASIIPYSKKIAAI